MPEMRLDDMQTLPRVRLLDDRGNGDCDALHATSVRGTDRRQEGEELSKLWSSRQLAEIGVFTAVYAALTWVLGPLSYQIFQFRISEALKSIVIPRRYLIWAFVIGNALSNVFSPFVGPWELLWMPFVNLIGAFTCWFVGRKIGDVKGMLVGSMIYAIFVSFGVSFMLSSLFNLPMLPLALSTLVPEAILIVGFSPVMSRLSARIDTF